MNRLFALLLLILAYVPAAVSQCDLPKTHFEQEPNMFTPEQEGYLGDVIAAQIELQLHLIHDDSINAYINQLAQGLLKNAPPSPFKYRLQMIDEPYANAFGIAGGRIYVTRQAALLAKNEDELAGLVAHELSHIYTRQLGADETRTFKEVLGGTQLGGREDVKRRYNQLLNTWRKKPTEFNWKHEEEEQYVADLTALYLMAHAGYRVSAFGDYFDRLAMTKGKTGSFWSDVFGGTAPNSKRLRLILNSVEKIPASCIEKNRPASDEFGVWQKKLLEWSGPPRKNSVRDVLVQAKLSPPLLSDLSRLQFSPDGKYILAQDDSTVTVLTREPFTYLFRVTLPNEPLPATFSPDSKYLVAGNQAGRVEKWSLADFKRISVTELPMTRQCVQTALSPDGNTLACFSRNHSLLLLNAATGDTLLEKKSFTRLQELQLSDVTIRWTNSYVNMAFSPDGHYFAANGDYSMFAWDITTKTPVEIRGALNKNMQAGGFTFLSDGRVVTSKGDSKMESVVMRFPSGESLYQFDSGGGQPRAVTKGNVIVLSPIKDYATGIYDLAAGKLLGGMKAKAFDAYGRQFVSEKQSGTLVLADLDNKEPIQYAQLPSPQLGNLRSLGISDDLKQIALSENSRSGIFDLTQGTRLAFMRGFRGAWFGPDDHLWVDFPAVEKADRALVSLDAANNNLISERKLDKAVAGRQRGDVFVLYKPAKGDDYEDETLEFHDVASDKLLWSRHVKKGRMEMDSIARTVVFIWNTSAPEAKEAGREDQRVATKLSSIRYKDDSFFMEVADLETGKTLGHLVIDSGEGSFAIKRIQATSDYLVISDNQDRVRLYSLATGEEVSTMYAENFDLSRAEMLAIPVDDYRLQIYDAKTAEQIDEYNFESPIVVAEFIGDGSRLLVLTRDQTVFVLKPQAHKTDTSVAVAE